jgi:hypothetical protein
MKWVLSLLGVVSVLIVATLLFLLREGVTIRPQPLIKPTEIKDNFEPVGQHVFLRLFPEFQSKDVVVWRIDLSQNLQEKFFKDVLVSWESQFKKQPQIYNKWPTESELMNCHDKCWVILDSKLDFEPHLLQLVNTNIKWLSVRTTSVNNLSNQISKECESQKILDENCRLEVSPYLVFKKLQKISQPAFFMHKYMDRDFYLFIYNFKK